MARNFEMRLSSRPDVSGICTCVSGSLNCKIIIINYLTSHHTDWNLWRDVHVINFPEPFSCGFYLLPPVSQPLPKTNPDHHFTHTAHGVEYSYTYLSATL